MSDRKFFKDLTASEKQWLANQTYRFGLLGPNFLKERADGTNSFDELPLAQRQRTFEILETPAVKADVAKIAIVQTPVDQKPVGWYKDENPNDLAIVNSVVSQDTIVVTELARAELARQRSAAAEAIDSSAPVPVINDASEAQALADRMAYLEFLQTKGSSELNNAQNILRDRYRVSNRDELNLVKIEERADGSVVATDNSINRQNLVMTQDEITRWRALNEISALQNQEDYEQKKYFKEWARSQLNVTEEDIVRINGSGGIFDPAFRDTDIAQAYQTELEIARISNNGKLPYPTPYSDYQESKLTEPPAASVTTAGGGVADKIESTGGADTSVALSAAERVQLASAPKTLDELKREAITGGKLPAAPQPAASQSDVVEVQPARDASGNTEFFDALVDAFQKSAVQVTDSSGAATNDNNVAAVQNNPLDAYESYTYGLALHVLEKSEYDNLAQNSKNWSPQHTLIASAGRWQETAESRAFSGGDYLKREEGWEDNFYFDNLKMTQLQSPSVTGRGTNTVEMEFTIVEPYGLTLLDRMIKTANKLREESYMHLCYMLQIDFFDSQKGLLIEHRKYLPITLTGMNIKVSGKGTQYIVQAYPFHYKALMNTVATTPLDVDVVSTTLREFFADENTADSLTGGAGAVAAVEREEESAKQSQAAQQGSGYTSGPNTVVAGGNGARVVAFQGQGRVDKVYEIHSYVAAYNGWWKKMKELNAVDPKIDPQNIKVRFADEIIAKEKLTKPVDAVASKGPMAKADAKQGTAPPEQNKYNGFGIKPGTNIVEVINTAMLSSEYVRSQVRVANKDESQTGNTIGTVNWWKILPQVKLNGFDNTLNRWSYSVTYFVVPYKIWNTKHPNLPKSSPRRVNCVKQYNYLYTGDNRSIIDFQVEFDMLYFTTVAGFKNINIDRVDRKESGAKDGAEQINPALDTNNRGSNSNSITPVVHNLVPHDASNSSGNNLTQDPVAVALGTIQDSIYSGVNGEMLTVNMKIIGDPTLLKQDDLFINIGEYYDPNRRSQSSDGILLGASHHGNPNLKANNSIVTDAGEVLAWVQVLMPPDIDENTGGLRLGSGASSVNSFTGVYKIMEVQNEFSQGKFIQTLILIRYQEQDADKDYREALSIERERIKSGINNDAGVTTPGNLARSSDQKEDAVSSDDAKDSSQVGISVASAGEESSLSQSASTVLPATQFNLLDTGNLPESVIERTDLV